MWSVLHVRTYALLEALIAASCAATSSSAGAALRHSNPLNPVELDSEVELPVPSHPSRESTRSSGSCHDESVGPIGAVLCAPDCIICLRQCFPSQIAEVGRRIYGAAEQVNVLL